MTMRMTNAEKLLGIMLAEIMQKVGVTGEVDPMLIKRLITSDSTWAIDWAYSGISGDHADPQPAYVDEASEIMAMWNIIEAAVRNRGGFATVGLKADPKFVGFDGNNETDYFGVALTLVNDLDRFSDFKGRSLNSHSRSLPQHRAALVTYNAELARNNYNLDDAGLRATLEAGWPGHYV